MHTDVNSKPQRPQESVGFIVTKYIPGQGRRLYLPGVEGEEDLGGELIKIYGDISSLHIDWLQFLLSAKVKIGPCSYRVNLINKFIYSKSIIQNY